MNFGTKLTINRGTNFKVNCQNAKCENCQFQVDVCARTGKNETLVVLEHPPERLESEGSEIELIYFVKIQSL